MSSTVLFRRFRHGQIGALTKATAFLVFKYYYHSPSGIVSLPSASFRFHLLTPCVLISRTSITRILHSFPCITVVLNLDTISRWCIQVCVSIVTHVCVVLLLLLSRPYHDMVYGPIKNQKGYLWFAWHMIFVTNQKRNGPKHGEYIDTLVSG